MLSAAVQTDAGSGSSAGLAHPSPAPHADGRDYVPVGNRPASSANSVRPPSASSVAPPPSYRCSVRSCLAFVGGDIRLDVPALLASSATLSATSSHSAIACSTTVYRDPSAWHREPHFPGILAAGFGTPVRLSCLRSQTVLPGTGCGHPKSLAAD